MTVPHHLSDYPLSDFFLREYLSNNDDPNNFPPNEFPDLFERYARAFSVGLEALALTRDELIKRPEFKFDRADAGNLEGSIATLRVAEFLKLKGFLNIELVNAPANADLMCEQNGHRVCLEVKATTKQSSGRAGMYLETQVYDRVYTGIEGARKQLRTTATERQCDVKVFVCVLNWLSHSLCLYPNDYLRIYRWLKADRHLQGIDGVLFITKMGVTHWFPTDVGNCIDCSPVPVQI
jgi:hypothetical protein